MQLQIHRRNIVFDFPWSLCHQRSNLLLRFTLSKFRPLIYWISFLFHIWKSNIHSELLGRKVIILESICKTLTKKHYVKIMEGYWVTWVGCDLVTKPPTRIMFILYKNISKRNIKKLFNSEWATELPLHIYSLICYFPSLLSLSYYMCF